MFKTLFPLILILFTSVAFSSDLKEIDLSSPQSTYKTFYSSVSDYSKGVQTDNNDLILRLHDALETFEPSSESSPYTVSHLEDKAVLLKEILDRVIAPLEGPVFEGNRIKGTNIIFVKVGPWFYISHFTLKRAETDYNNLINKPYKKGIKNPGASHKKNWLEKAFPKGNIVKYFGITQIQWTMIVLSIISAILIYFAAIWILGLLESLILSKRDFSFKIAKALTQPASIFITAFFLKAAGAHIALTGNAKFIWVSSTKTLLSIGSFWLLYCLISPVESALRKITEKTESDLDDQLVPLVSKTAKVVIISLAVLTTIQGLGVNVFSLLAGLGVGGLAIALAAKDTAANFFGSLMILFDQPFKVGDWIKLDGLEGTVEEIGFRSTRVRTFYDSQIVIPNSKVANSDIDNLGRRQYRRTVETLGLTYGTTEEQLRSFTEGLKKIINEHPLTRKDKHYTSFKKFGDSSLEILLYFFLNVSDYKDELKAKEEILLKIKNLAETLSVDFAFPSQSIYLEKSDV